MISIDFDIVERDPRRIMGIDHDGALALDAACFGIDQEKRDPVALAGVPGRARSHDQEVGDVAVDDEGFRAVEPKTVAGAYGLHLGFERAMLSALVNRQCRDQFARRDLWQELASLRVAAAARQRGCGEHCR